MKIKSLLAIGLIGLAGLASVASAEEAHKIIAPSDVKWGPAPEHSHPEQKRRFCSAIRARKACLPSGSNSRPGMRSRRIPILSMRWSQ